MRSFGQGGAGNFSRTGKEEEGRASVADVMTRVVKTRKALKVSQKELAKRIGKSEKTIYNWENGLRDPGVNGLLDIANAMGVSAQLFFEPDNSGESRITQIAELENLARMAFDYLSLLKQKIALIKDPTANVRP